MQRGIIQILHRLLQWFGAFTKYLGKGLAKYVRQSRTGQHNLYFALLLDKFIFILIEPTLLRVYVLT